jgi:hypothetical protein
MRQMRAKEQAMNASRQTHLTKLEGRTLKVHVDGYSIPQANRKVLDVYQRVLVSYMERGRT